MAHSQQRSNDERRNGVDVFRLAGGDRVHLGTFRTERAAKQAARLDFHTHGSRRYVLMELGGGLVCEGYTVSAGSVADFVVTYGWGGSKPDPDPPPALAVNVPPMANRIAYLTSRLGRREAA